MVPLVFKRKKCKTAVPMRAHGIEVALSPGTKNVKIIKHLALTHTRNIITIKGIKKISKCIGRSLPSLVLEGANEIAIK